MKSITFPNVCVRLILDGNKTQTRRLGDTCRYKVGDRVYVRESHIHLEITDVRAEHLQDISDEDAVAEGIRPMVGFDFDAPKGRDAVYNSPISELYYGTPQEAYSAWWDHIYAKKPEVQWDKNPWVWAIGFKVIGAKEK